MLGTLSHSTSSDFLFFGVCAGEMEVVRSPKAAVSDRDPLSQPVHCEWACVLVSCSCEARHLTCCSGRGQTKHHAVEKCPTFCLRCAGCKRYAVLFRKHVSRQGAGKGKAVLEFLGLTPGSIDLCYQDNPRNEEEAIQDGLKKWQETQGDNCTWQDLLEAMTFAGIAEQHCSQLVQELHQWLQGEDVTLGVEPSSAQC